MTLRAPFPWFGGKSRAADVIWRAFGNVPNYVEPGKPLHAAVLAPSTDDAAEVIR